MNAPCRDCPERHPLCHDACERYQAYASERREISRERKASAVRNFNDKQWHSRFLEKKRKGKSYRR